MTFENGTPDGFDWRISAAGLAMGVLAIALGVHAGTAPGWVAAAFGVGAVLLNVYVYLSVKYDV